MHDGIALLLVHGALAGFVHTGATDALDGVVDGAEQLFQEVALHLVIHTLPVVTHDGVGDGTVALHLVHLAFIHGGHALHILAPMGLIQRTLSHYLTTVEVTDAGAIHTSEWFLGGTGVAGGTPTHRVIYQETLGTDGFVASDGSLYGTPVANLAF